MAAMIPPIVPLIPKTGILPGRITPRLIPRLGAVASRIKVHIDEIGTVMADGTPITIPAADLAIKLISNSNAPEGDFHEFYALMRGGDPEGFLDISVGPGVAENEARCEIARTCHAKMDMYVDDALIGTMDQIVEGAPSPLPALWVFSVPLS